MCTDSNRPAAPDSAIRVAIIHPLSDPSFHARLSFSNGTCDGTKTTLQCADEAAGGSLNVRIHKYGEPLSSCLRPTRASRTSSPIVGSGLESDSDLEDDSDSGSYCGNGDDDDDSSSNPVVHSFPVSVTTTGSDASGGTSSSTISSVRLDLGVGGDGVVGRTVSIVDRKSGKILGEGIIGWS
ncbi:hypothetical protein PV04_07597 [Phialophora macrospora]|uniref:Uncharacterized protein n=1 Tax=Phialophora macrospora TaxID=1851006 RepID=A0A0D2DT54_9EURO|nr:hypothetical protein PV04_07597 [Phialophora macrospora]